MCDICEHIEEVILEEEGVRGVSSEELHLLAIQRLRQMIRKLIRDTKGE